MIRNNVCELSIAQDSPALFLFVCTPSGFMLAKAITGHKSQGLGMPALLLHCDEKHALEPGWLFTALTRLKTSILDKTLKLRIVSPPSTLCAMACSPRRMGRGLETLIAALHQPSHAAYLRRPLFLRLADHPARRSHGT